MTVRDGTKFWPDTLTTVPPTMICPCVGFPNTGFNAEVGQGVFVGVEVGGEVGCEVGVDVGRDVAVEVGVEVGRDVEPAVGVGLRPAPVVGETPGV